MEAVTMGKISPVSAKYIIHAQIQIEGVVDRSDVIGSVFGQTEGLLGADLELRELQRSGRIGRIEVDLDNKNGKSEGTIIIPSSLDKVETALIAASVETIQRIGPCNSYVKVLKVEDVRIAKRTQVIDRAKQLLSDLTHLILPDSKDVKEQVSDALRTMGVVEYGADRLPAGPMIDESDEIILVEGRADVISLLKADIKNAIAMNGTSVPKTVVDLCKTKTATVFVDGDRGGDLIIKELSLVTEIDFVTKAPDGKEVEELTQKEIYKALRSKVAFEQVKLDERAGSSRPRTPTRQTTNTRAPSRDARPERRTAAPRRGHERTERRPTTRRTSAPRISEQETTHFKKMLEDLIGTHGAYILDAEKNILGKVPLTELGSTVTSLRGGVNAIVLDGTITKDIVDVAEKVRVRFVVGMDSAVKQDATRVNLVTNKDL